MSEVVDCIAWIVRKTFWSLGVLLQFLGLRLLDLFGLIFNLLACCTLVRLPHMIGQFMLMDNFWRWRFDGLIQLGIFLSDIPIFIMFLFVLITIFRVKPCCNELSANWEGWMLDDDTYYSGWKLRKIIAKNFFKSFIDLFCLPIALMLLLSWRSVIFIRKIKKAESDSKRRKTCFIQFFQLLLDIPLILLSILPVLSWRLPVFVYQIRKGIKNKEDWDELRFLGPVQCFYLFLDIPCLVMFVVTLVTWRCPIMIWQLSHPEYPFYRKRQQKTIRKIITLQFLYVFLDIPCIVCLTLVLPLWRLPSFMSRCRKALAVERKKHAFYKKEMRIRESVLIEFVMVFVDLICFAGFLVVILTLWRTYPLVKDVKTYLARYRKDDTRRQTTADDVNKLDGEKEPISPTSTQQPLNYSSTATTTTIIAEGDVVGSTSTKEQENTIQEENKEKEKKSPLSWSKCMWKIRKTICIHFLLLIVDLPAIPLCIFLLITGLRTSRLISDLVGGQFYMLFAVSVYYHALHFLVDVFFIILFLVLCILRPKQVWVNILEDEDHQRHRELKDIMQWMPDIAKQRHKLYTRLTDILNISFKRGTAEYECLAKLKNEMDDYIIQMEALMEKLSRHEIEDEFVTLLATVIFHEKQRTARMMRLFRAEHNYLRRPDTKVHAQNTARLERERIEYELVVSSAYEKLNNYVPPRVPMYEKKTGLALRSRDETKRVLIKTLPKGGIPVFIGVLICCLPLYRAPRMLHRLAKRWYARFDILKDTFYEYGLDLITMGRIMFVLLCVYRAPFMLADITDSVIEKRSWRAVRQVVKRYPALIVSDIFELMVTLFSWKTPRFIFTALMFGVLMPADLFLTVCKSCSNSKSVNYFASFLMYVIFMGFPFVYSFYWSEQLMAYGLGWTNQIFICAFVVVLLLVLLTMVVSLSRDTKKSFLLKMPDADYVRFNWYNFHVVAFEVLEFFQSIALVFKLSPVIPMYGAVVLADASKILLFSFLPFEAVFWTTVAVFTVWFFVCGAPIIFENILESSPIGTCGKRPSWRLTISLLANTLFVFFVENFASFSACRYEQCPSSYDLGDVPANATCRRAIFVEDSSLQCWSESGPHRNYATFGLIGFVWYATTALIFDTQYGDPDTSEQDIGFSPVYNTGINILKAGAVVSVTIITNSPYAALACLLLFNLVSILFTFLFKVILKFYPCNFGSVLVWRLCTFASTCVVVVGVMVAFVLNDPTSKIPLMIMGGGVLIVFIVSLSVAIKLRQISETEKERELFRAEILKLEKRIESNKWFLPGWQQEGREGVWRRLVRSVRSAQKLDKWLTPKTDLASTPSMMRLKDRVNDEFDYKPPPIVESGMSSATNDIPMSQSQDIEINSLKTDVIESSNDKLKDEDVKITVDIDSDSDSEKEKEESRNEEENVAGKSDFIQPEESGDDGIRGIVIKEEETNDKENEEAVNGKSEDIEVQQHVQDVPNRNSHFRHSFHQITSSSHLMLDQDQPTPPPPIQTPTQPDLGLPPPPSYEAVQNNATFYTLRDFQIDPDELMRLEKNGRNLLVALEKYVDYKAYKYSFFLQRDLWLNSAWNANWGSLLQCLRVLNANLTGDFDRPSSLDLRLAQPAFETDLLVSDNNDDLPGSSAGPPAPFVRETKEMKSVRSLELRELALNDVSEIGKIVETDRSYAAEWRQLFDRLLPNNDGVIKSWTCSKHEQEDKVGIRRIDFELLLRRKATGRIVEVNKEEGGNKLAIGATLAIGKRLSGSLTDSNVVFNEGIVGKKGPVSVTIEYATFIQKKNKTYISVSEKKVALDMVLASVHKIKWE